MADRDERPPDGAARPSSRAPALRVEPPSSLSSCVLLPQQGVHARVPMPWLGFGTYKLAHAREAVGSALQLGYRAVDSAFIYGGEKTEPQTGAALEAALEAMAREELFVTTKHWRKFHGYEPSLACLRTSLRRLRLEYVDLWLMHWPGPAWKTMSRRKDEMAANGVWHYAAAGHERESLPALRAETWRAMEDALAQGLARSIGVSNFNIQHLQTLKKTARIWPPAVNQVELNPYYQQRELQEYCAAEGIVLQAYASLGGQDASRATVQSLGGPLLEAPPVLDAASANSVTPAQVLLRWALQKRITVIPKANDPSRALENLRVFHFELSERQMNELDSLERGSAGRTCWRNDPMRMLDFD
mmetsp:Transcript_33937/g.77796  ORF Transcript_33937/g.77796 Transcript_33937/m.77796 type:complete len:359 (-) Transcript_33937:305-1381(-)